MFCNFVFSHEVCRPIVVAALSKRLSFRLLRSVYSCNVFIQKNKLENQKQFVVTHDCHMVAYINIVCTQLQRFNNVVEFNAYIQYIGYRS